MLTVDEEIYRLLPSLLIVTVDKFAPLPWYGQAGLLFGRTTQWCSRHGYRHDDLDKQHACGNWHKARGSRGKDVSEAAPRLRPSDLIIQDELHLISGALGTTVGHFEAAVDQLCTRTWKDEDGAEHQAGPKIVASRHHQGRRRPGARRLRPKGRRLPAPWGRGGGRSPHARGWSRAHGRGLVRRLRRWPGGPGQCPSPAHDLGSMRLGAVRGTEAEAPGPSCRVGGRPGHVPGPGELRHVCDTATCRAPVTAGQRRAFLRSPREGADPFPCPQTGLRPAKSPPGGGRSVAPPAGLEPAAKRLEGACSIH